MYKTKQTEVQYGTVYYKNCDVGCVLENVPESTFQQQTAEIKTNISNHKVLFHWKYVTQAMCRCVCEWVAEREDSCILAAVFASVMKLNKLPEF
jgi:hypothetical protein